MSMLRVLIVATLLGSSLATALPVLAATAPSRTTQEQVLFDLLEAPHPQVDAKTLQRLGPDVPSILIRYATTKTTKKTMQLRALAWLQHVPSTQTLAVLREVLYARDSDRTTLRTALRALGGGFGLAAWDDLRRHLTHREAQVREAAVWSMRDAVMQVPPERIQALLEGRLESEPEAFVRDAILEVLQQLRGK
jgi:hypothetical protein